MHYDSCRRLCVLRSAAATPGGQNDRAEIQLLNERLFGKGSIAGDRRPYIPRTTKPRLRKPSAILPRSCEPGMSETLTLT